MRRRLTDEERDIRSGAGIPFARWWPVLVLIITWSIAAVDYDMFERCLGYRPHPHTSRGSLVALPLAGLCSPFLLRGSPAEWLLFAGMWVPVPFAIRNWFWRKRHKAYWDRIRLREKERRADRKAETARAKDVSEEQP
jgi:hypothetical protein